MQPYIYHHLTVTILLLLLAWSFIILGLHGPISVSDLFVPYIRPSENGARVRVLLQVLQ